MDKKKIKITARFINSGISVNGGWSKKQLDLLGVGRTPPKGWMTLIIGKHISKNNAKKFIDLRDKHLDVDSSINRGLNNNDDDSGFFDLRDIFENERGQNCIVVTANLWAEGKSANGGCSTKQIKLLKGGVNVLGRKKGCIGNIVSVWNAKEFLDLKNHNLY